MKTPRYFVETIADAIRVGLNGFALQLMAESFADDPAKFGDDNVVLLAHAHNGHEVWFIMSKARPCAEDFSDSTAHPEAPPPSTQDPPTKED